MGNTLSYLVILLSCFISKLDFFLINVTINVQSTRINVAWRM